MADSIKALSLSERESKIRRAWYVQFRPEDANGAPIAPPGVPTPYVVDVYEDVIVIEKGGDYFSYPYAIGAEGVVTFSDPIKVEKEFVAAKAASTMMTSFGGELKALPDGLVEGLAVRFSNASQKDLVGDYFDKRTDFEWQGLETRPALFNHGLDATLKDDRLGAGWKLSKIDEVGLWVQNQLDLRKRYEDAVYKLSQAGKLGLSSATAPHLIARDPDGHLRRWSIAEISFTPTPAEPTTTVVPLKFLSGFTLESFLKESGISLETAQAGAAGAAQPLGTKQAPGTTIDTEAQTFLTDKIQVLVPELTPDQLKKVVAILELWLTGQGEGEGEGQSTLSTKEFDMDKKEFTEAMAEALKTVGIVPQPATLPPAAPPASPAPGARPPYAFTPAASEGTPDGQQAAYAKAVNVIRFGEPDAAIKAVLVDLHGQDWEQKRWEQWKAFNRYLRHYGQEPDGEDRKLLKSIVLTPDLVKQAILQGTDVSALKTDMVEAVDSLGGYVAPSDFQMRVLSRLQGLVVMRGRATPLNTSRDRVELPMATGGDSQYTSAVRVTWVDETPTAGAAATNLTFGLVTIPVHTVMAETFLSRNLIEDAAFDLAGYLQQKFAEASAVDEDNKFLIGDGVGKPTGLLPGGLNSLSLTHVASLDASTITWDGLIALSYGVDSQYRQSPACAWLGRKDTYRQLRQLKNGLSQYYWQPDNQQGQPAMLLGYPTLEQESIPAVAAGAVPLVFGDLAGYSIVDRVGMTVERYLDSATARQNMVCYVMRRRLGGKVTETWRFGVMVVEAS